ncbi:Carbonic anhydrase 2 [Planctomycetes bacterium Pan216]|uniref:Carbonic anhydrase 2 n=1 Tax=Kolteria novifilia TaxID=2527975 RepID=A0A518B2I8_9BACT|nr:Carbonic anhydrase 2 [Planctomycetes bacterium Pan216]
MDRYDRASLFQSSSLVMVAVAALSLQSAGCALQTSQAMGGEKEAESAQDLKPLVTRVLTREEQEKLTPKEVLQSLKNGNQRFVNGTLTVRDHSSQIRKASLGQFPKAVILSCLDSRIPVEDVFDRGIGDIFVARVAGNFENTDILGSMEFGCKVAGAKLIVVLGHEQCGAIKAAIDDVELGNITAMLKNIRPAVKRVEKIDGDKSSKNDELVRKVTLENVRMTMENIRAKSDILRQMEQDDAINIVGAYYNMDTGVVTFFDH